ncbi:tetratricopeptide repeat protein [Bacteroidota bacterium]
MRLLLLIFLIVIITSCKQKVENKEEAKQQSEQTTDDSKPALEISEINKAIRANPEDAENYYLRAILYGQQQRYKEAVDDLEIAMRRDSTRPEFYILESDNLISLKRPEEALSSLERGIDLFPNDTTTLLKISEFYYYLKNYQKSHQYLSKLQNIDRYNEKSYFIRGLIFLETADTIKAIRNFQSAAEVNPDYFDAYMMLGIVYSLSDDDLAIGYFKNAIDINSKHVEVRIQLGLYYQKHGMYPEAIAQYKFISDELDAEFEVPYFNTGYIYLEFIKDYERAIPYFQLAYQKDPTYADAYYNEGLCYEYLNNIKKARELYKKSLEVVPNYIFGVRGLNRLDNLERGKK